MFLGHFALAMAAPKADPKVSLRSAVLAAQLADVAWPIFVLAGVERVAIAPGDTAVTPLRFESYPYSHSLLALGLWAVAFAALHFAKTRLWRGSLLLAGLVVSHWVLDALSHRADMPLTPWSAARVGLGLWQSLPATLVVESLLFVLGATLYLRSRTGGRAAARFKGLCVFLVVVYLANLFGPPPPSVSAIGIAGVLGALIVIAWAAWVEA